MSRLIDADPLFDYLIKKRERYQKYIDKFKSQNKKREADEMARITAEVTTMLHKLLEAPTIETKIKWTSISEKLPDEGIDVICKTESGFQTIASYGQLYPNDKEEGWITAEFNRFQTNFFAKWRPIIEDDD